MTDEVEEQCCGIAPHSQVCAVQRTAEKSACPGCGTRLRPMSTAHVMHQLHGPRGRGIEGVASFGFCPVAECTVVYLGTGGERFEVDDLRRPPAYKTGRPSDLLCYCFDVTGAEALSHAGDAAIAFISERIRADDCACDVLNPSAGCCLGSIGAYRKAHTPTDSQRA